MFGHACRKHRSPVFQTGRVSGIHTLSEPRSSYIFTPFQICTAPIFSHRPIRTIPIFLPCPRPYKRKNAGQPFLTDRQSQSLITHAQAFRLPLFHIPLISPISFLLFNFSPLISRKSTGILTSGPARLLSRIIFLKQHTHKPCFLLIPAVNCRLLRGTILLTIYRVYDR